MTDNTHPEAMDLADWLEAVGGGPSAKRCAALLREQHARIAELESELEAVGAGGVSGPLIGRASLSANAGEPRNAIDRDALIDAIAQGLRGTWHCTRVWEAWHVGAMSQDDFEPVDESETPTEIADAVLALLAAPPAAPATQQAGEISDYLVLAITTAYEQGVGKGRQAYEAGKEISNPYSTGYRCDLAWAYGYDEGKKQATRMAAPQPSLAAQADSQPAPLSEMPYEKREAIKEGEQIGASDAWFKARHEMLDTVDRRNVFRAGFDRGWNAALAAQGGN